jgi:hypothetical protein
MDFRVYLGRNCWPRRYEWSRPGALLHIDVKRLVRFERPGHRVSGDRQRRSRRVGFEYLHWVVDDNSRYAWVELHPREDTATAAAMLTRVLADLREFGLEPPEPVVTDNALIYTGGASFQAALEQPAPATSPPRLTRHAGTAKPNASSKRCNANGCTPTPGKPRANAPVRRSVLVSARTQLRAGDSESVAQRR